jgi:hypothetical protein
LQQQVWAEKQIGLAYGLTVYVTMKYLGVALYPDGLLIPFVTHAVWRLVPLALELMHLF